MRIEIIGNSIQLHNEWSEGAEYRRRREREMLGKREPIRKACGLFSNDAAQKFVR